MTDTSRLLVVDDEPELCALVARALPAPTFEVAAATSTNDALAALEDGNWDVLLVDIQLAGKNGIELARQAIEMVPGLVVVVMTAFGTVDNAIEAIRAGAFDFLVKPFDLRTLGVVVERAARYASLSREVERLRDMERRARTPDAMLGESPRLERVRDLVRRVAPTDVTVLLQGESGTGKELVARAIHAQSHRSSGPFAAVNCGALPSELLESELFGHVRGAFTGAASNRVGLLEDASGGTLLLDEVGDMPPEMQVKLLRALQDRTVRPVGGTEERPFDVRVVCATHRDLETEVAEGRFREDLYYRINVVQIDVPPLRARGNDVLLLAHHFVRRAAERTGREVTGIDKACAARLAEYHWPGNVRELENAMERAVALTEWSELTVDDLPARVRDHRVDAVVLAGADITSMPTLAQLEEQYIARVLERCAQNKAEAARVLGIDRRTLYRKLERYE